MRILFSVIKQRKLMRNRLFIRTVGHLYCIGDPKVAYNWNPKSRQ